MYINLYIYIYTINICIYVYIFVKILIPVVKTSTQFVIRCSDILFLLSDKHKTVTQLNI